jgi:hypothetical protein
MFMRFRGGGVGHLGTRSLDSRLKDNPGDEEQDEVTLVGRHENDNSYPHDERGDGIEEGSGPETHEECTTRRNPSNKEGRNDGDGSEVEDKDEDNHDAEDADEGADNEQVLLGNTDDGQDIEDEDAIDDEILDEEGYAEL